MSERRRCPSCRGEIPPGDARLAAQCPLCGAPLPARAPSRRRRTVRRRPRFDLVGPAWALGATVLLFAVSFGFSELVRHTIGRPRAVVAGEAQSVQSSAESTPVSHAPEPAPWAARPDPPTQPEEPLTFPPGPGVPLDGEPVLASGHGPYFFETLTRGPAAVGVLAPRDVTTFPVYDLRTAKPAHAFAMAVPRSRGSVLSPDGRYLVGPIAHESKLGAFQPDQPGPRAGLTIPTGIHWLNFLSPEEVAVACGDEIPREIRVWNIARDEVVHSFPLPPEVFPLPPRWGRVPRRPTGFQFAPNPLAGAVSPGKHCLALGGSGGIALLSLEDGRHLGKLPIADAGGSLAYRGLSFSDDGSVLTAVLAFPGEDNPTSVRLRSWKIEDGSVALDVELADRIAHGPPVPGRDGNTVWLARVDQSGGMCVDVHTGKTVWALASTPLRRLVDGRLLVVGPIQDAPPGTPLPRSAYVNPPDAAGITPEAFRRELKEWEEKQRKDPNVRALYAIAAPR